MPLNLHPLVTAEFLTHAQHTLVLSTVWMGLALLASAAVSMVVAVAALIWTARDDRASRAKPGSRDPWGYDLTDGETRAIEREGIDRLRASSLGGGRNG